MNHSVMDDFRVFLIPVYVAAHVMLAVRILFNPWKAGIWLRHL
jgi:hypothetical protein